jgi:uncharacterized protein
VEDPRYAAALCGALNTWLADEWLGQERRLRSSIAIPIEAPDLAAEEIRRRADDPRFVQVLLSAGGESGFGVRRYWPIHRAAAEAGLPVAAHTGGLEQQLRQLREDALGDQAGHLVTLLECGASWLPTLLWRFDKDWKDVWREVPWLDAKPSQVARRHLRMTTAPTHLPRDPDHVRQALDLLDAASMLMYASDHPHDHGDGGERLLAALTDAERERVLSGNAASWYQLET